MPLVDRKGLLAIAAVVDVALHSGARPVSAKALAVRHALPARYLEQILQALVHNGILRGISGPRGGYEMARDPNNVTAEDILASAVGIARAHNNLRSGLVNSVVRPALKRAEHSFSVALRQITVTEMIERARHRT